MGIHNPIHPGLIIQDILIDRCGLSVNDAAKKLHVNRVTLSRLLNGKTGISPLMALRLSKLLPNTNVNFWLRIQANYDSWVVTHENHHLCVSPLKPQKAA